MLAGTASTATASGTRPTPFSPIRPCGARRYRTLRRYPRLSARHRIVPDAFARRVEDQRGAGWGDAPVVARQLGFQLAGRPAGVAERDQGFPGALVAGDVAQDLQAGGDRQVGIDRKGVLAIVVGAVDDKADLGLHRPTGKDADA